VHLQFSVEQQNHHTFYNNNNDNNNNNNNNHRFLNVAVNTVFCFIDNIKKQCQHDDNGNSEGVNSVYNNGIYTTLLVTKSNKKSWHKR